MDTIKFRTLFCNFSIYFIVISQATFFLKHFKWILNGYSFYLKPMLPHLLISFLFLHSELSQVSVNSCYCLLE